MRMNRMIAAAVTVAVLATGCGSTATRAQTGRPKIGSAISVTAVPATTPPTTPPPTVPPTTTDPSIAAHAAFISAMAAGLPGFQNDLQAISTDASNQDISSMTADCQAADDDLNALPDAAGAPDWMHDTYVKFQSDFDQAFTLCVSGTTDMNADELQQSIGFITAGTADTTQLNAEIAANS